MVETEGRSHGIAIRFLVRGDYNFFGNRQLWEYMIDSIHKRGANVSFIIE
jgi:hypothetical protein